MLSSVNVPFQGCVHAREYVLTAPPSLFLSA